eukprot:CAMPEP_0184862962 /NCGR_PEP_ID=MMETSP0580-20130426/8176_1 /TAXON_ID=1118495 /ORGANISM="Dactyliosolen fragilissimus" /LENGTH=273 /DNA_ID=CAMNT_0027360989 /DNA_START=292 /DNA_END=1113 /DNA_ORIENTATION=+
MSATALNAGKKSAIPIPSIPNPFKALPWNVKKEKEREARRIKLEKAKLHRELGLAEDATFEEITVVTDSLIAKAESENDIKKKLKIEIAKDRIMQMRLNERLAGLTVLTEEAKAQSRLEEEEEDDEDLFPEEKKKKEWRVPRFAENLIVKPDVAYRNTQVKVFGILSAIAFFLPPVSEKIIMINWLFAAGQLARRGMPDDGGEYNPYARKGGPHQRTALMLSFLVWLVLRIWVTTLGSITRVLGPRYIPVMETIFINIGLGFFTAYTQTYKPK